MKKAVHEDHKEFGRFVSDLPHGLFDSSGEVLRNDRNCVKVFTEGGRKIVVKKFKRPNVFNRVVYTFLRGSKAERAYNNALKLRELDINSPMPIGFIDVGRRGLLTECYLVTEYTDYQPVGDIVAGPESDNTALFDSFVEFTVRLHEKGVRHDDYNTSNVLYKRRDDGMYDFTLIDNNRMKFGPLNERACIHNLKRVCTKPEFTVRFAMKYAQLRNRDGDRYAARLSSIRLAFERRRARKRFFKKWIKSLF